MGSDRRGQVHWRAVLGRTRGPTVTVLWVKASICAWKRSWPQARCRGVCSRRASASGRWRVVALGVLSVCVAGFQLQAARVRFDVRLERARRVASIASPGVVRRMGRHARADRIEFDVAVAGEGIGLAADPCGRSTTLQAVGNVPDPVDRSAQGRAAVTAARPTAPPARASSRAPSAAASPSPRTPPAPRGGCRGRRAAIR